MASVQCRVCGQGDAIAFCSETGDPMCGNCAASCQVCRAPINKRRLQATSTGRKLCAKCMAERNARRKEKKDELRRAQTGAKPSPAPAARAGTSFSALMDAPPRAAGTSFQDLLDGDDAPMMSVRAADDERGPDSAPEVHGLGPAEDDARVWGAEGPPKEGSGRLQLPIVDDKRPILTASGYQGPSRTAWIAAFALFGIAAGIFWTVSPAFREILIPADLARPDFVSNARPVATDTNQLRDAGNIKQFDILKYGPIFIVAWLVVGAYCIGFFLIMISLARSLTSSYFAKRRLKKAEKFTEKYGQVYPD